MLTKISVGIGTLHILASTALSQCEVQVVHDPDGVKDDHFGSSVGIDGEWAVVGAFGVGIGGAAYAFERVAGQWLQVAELTASDEAQNRLFGASVAIHGDWIAVGDGGHDGLGESSGVVYLFHNEGGIWSEHSILIANDNLAGDQFGWEAPNKRRPGGSRAARASDTIPSPRWIPPAEQPESPRG